MGSGLFIRSSDSSHRSAIECWPDYFSLKNAVFRIDKQESRPPGRVSPYDLADWVRTPLKSSVDHGNHPSRAAWGVLRGKHSRIPKGP